METAVLVSRSNRTFTTQTPEMCFWRHHPGNKAEGIICKSFCRAPERGGHIRFIIKPSV